MPMKKNPRTIYGFNISMNISFLFNPIWVPGQFLKWRCETDYQIIRLDLDSQTGSEQISKAGSLNSGFRPIWDQIWEVNRFYSNLLYDIGQDFLDTYYHDNKKQKMIFITLRNMPA